MARFPDLGELLVLDGPAIKTTWVPGGVFHCGRSDLRVQLDIDAAPLSQLGAIMLKLESSRDGARWCDFASVRDDSSQFAVEQSITVAPGEQRSLSLSAVTKGTRYMRWSVRASGAGVAGDRVVITGSAA